MKQWLGVLALVTLAGCQTQPNIKQMEDENRTLQGKLDSANSEILALKAREDELEIQVTELSRVMGVLDTEKTVRVQESSELRGQVRRFVQQNVDALKEFLVQSDLLDYVGGELVQRSQVDDKSLLLVDMANPMPANGTITGVSAHFINPGTFTVQVMRPVAGDLVTIWQSGSLQAPKAGVTRVNFPVNVGVEKGDYIAYYFNAPGLVSYDTGTGDTRYQDDPLSLGEVLKAGRLKGEREKRAYSVGVYGLLN